MKKEDIENIQLIMEGNLYDGEWSANIVKGSLPQGNHLAYQSGYILRIGDQEAELDEGIRGKNSPRNARVVGNVVYLSYVQN